MAQDQKIVSRAALFDEIDEHSGGEAPVTEPDFEFVEVGVTDAVEDSVNPEFELFPLFSAGGVTRVELGGSEEEEVDVRPVRNEGYYFAERTEEVRERALAAAVSFEQVLGVQTAVTTQRRVLDVSVYNLGVEHELRDAERRRRRKPGKRQRDARRDGARRVLEREEQRLMVKKLIKKTFKRRGGKKHKKRAATVGEAPATSIPTIAH
ncbi:uncharacterized protein KNAG_0H02205 [Huiozyma naganishii CBS 8797]|uniref:Uncharacterized protein n=1 Tax=Huiozyma naganishii (strain ATCC MYA-139 / BCRC 22969 / CBS 8797 / KCTC 17520 / NBRC 10181 / NCYC 3082 / Yp74L-3) TaxID=1071383 RepID=J7S8M1_HUIN7|nr:hypothetical protein KNAG_0H02205 [Kazachstania naganishii CBS 8797]CCK71634.1 hypothetical protein KNAG_0H02205 [Kazachstania naganishii CBS 8797]